MWNWFRNSNVIMILGSLFLCTRVCFTDFFYVSQCLMEFQVLFTGINQCLFLSVFGFWSVWILLQYLPLIWNKVNLSYQLIEISSPFPFSLLSQVYQLCSRVAVCSRVRNFWFSLWMSLCFKFVFCLSSLVCLGLFSRLSFFLNSVFFSSAFFANNVLLDMLRNRYSRIDELEQEVMDRPKIVDEGMKLQNNLLV